MPITINGSGTLTGVAVGGLPDGIVDTDMIAANAVTHPKKGSGSVLQVIGNLNTGGGTSTTSTDWTATYITDTITPVRTGSKIAVFLSGMGGYAASSTQGFANVTLGRNVNSEGVSYMGDASNGMAYVYSQAGASGWWDANISYLDSPTYTAGESIVYTMYFKCNTNVTTFAIGNGNSHSPIVLMEVAA